MKTSALIEGLTILQRYRKKDGYDLSAEHDAIYAHATDRALSEEDVARMRKLGWGQDTATNDDTNDVARMRELGWFQEGDRDGAVYDPTESWWANV